MLMNLRVKFTKENYLKYISHLDLMRLFQRAFRRANIPINYSEGFNPQPKFSIANPLALGIASEEEYMDMDLFEKMPIENFIESMNKKLPEDIRIIEAKYMDDSKSIAALISWAYYEIIFKANNIKSIEELKELVDKWTQEDEIMIKRVRHRRGKVTERIQNIRPLIGNIIIADKGRELLSNSEITINCLLKAGDNGNLKPTDLLEAMEKHLDIDIDLDSVDIKRLKLFTEVDGNIQSPMD